MSTQGSWAELDLRIFRVHGEAPQAELRFHEAAADTVVPRDPVFAETRLDIESLPPAQADLEIYGKALTNQVFAEPHLREAFCQGRRLSQENGQPLRLLLSLDPSVTELQGICWEALWDPHVEAPLYGSPDLQLSRLVTDQTWRRTRLRRKQRPRIVVTRAAPAKLEAYGFDINIEGSDPHEGWLTKAANGPEIRFEPKLTPTRLAQNLRSDDDILWICAAAVPPHREHPHLVLETTSGDAIRLPAKQLGQRMRELLSPPRLVVLSSPYPRRRSGPSALSRLAPWLAESGPIAVLVLEEGFSAENCRRVLQGLAEGWKTSGNVQRWVRLLRGELDPFSDAAKLRLFTSSRRASLWLEPSKTSDSESNVRWPALVTSLQAQKLTPILGWELGEGVFGSANQLATRIAGDGLPLASHQKGNLPLVSQVLQMTEHSSDHLLKTVKEQMAQEIYARHGHHLDASMERASLSRLMTESGRFLRRRDDDPFRQLAELPCPIYINASADTLLREALQAAGKEPQILFPRWKRGHPPEAIEREPTVQRPLVYQIFGYFGDEDSLVLTEDDQIEFLIRSGRHDLPAVVRHALIDTSLLFLGFRMGDWSFRVLHFLMMNLDGRARLQRFSHAVVQADPEIDTTSNWEQLRRYFAKYYGESKKSNIRLFWGRSDEFLHQLGDHWRGDSNSGFPGRLHA